MSLLGTIGKIALGALAVAVAFVPGVGIAISGYIAGSLFAAGVVSSAVIVATTAAIVSGITLIGFSAGLSGLASAMGAGKVPEAQLGRLTLGFDINATRKTAYGETALATDVIYWEPSGTNQEYADYIIVVAAHEVEAITSIYSEGKLMWTLAGGATTDYVGYLTVTVRTVGTSANGIAINGGGTWSSACTLTGCAYLHIRIKRTGNTSKASSPFAAGLPSRMTVIGKGAKVYDPRLDSTVAGGSGAHRANNQATWQYANGGTVLGTNPALQALHYLLGYTIGGKVSVGVGAPIDRIEMTDWIAAANKCDEAVSILPSGTHRRYETHGVFADSDAPLSVLSVLCGHMNAELRDVTGKLGIRINYNDLTGTIPDFTADDVLGAFSWEPYSALQDSFNIVLGRYSDPSTNALYQLTPYTQEEITSVDGINRTSTFELPMCQDPVRAQRIARQVLRRESFRGAFKADFGPRALSVKAGNVIRLTFGPAGIASQLFRIAKQDIRIVMDNEGARRFCTMELHTESTWIYDWTASDGVTPASAIPIVAYNPLNTPFLITQGTDVGVANGADVTAVNAPQLAGNLAWEISGNVAGVVTSVLPADRRFKTYQGTTDVSATTSWVLSDISPTLAITVNNSSDRGLVTLGSGTTGSGVATLTATLASGVAVLGIITVTKTNASASSSGGAGATFAQDTTFVDVGSGSHIVISDELTVRSDGSSHVRIALEGGFVPTSGTASSNLASKFSYATTSGGALTDLISEVGGSASTYNSGTSERYDGSIYHAEATFTMPAPNTDYYFKAQARRSLGSAAIAFTYANFTVRQ